MNSTVLPTVPFGSGGRDEEPGNEEGHSDHESARRRPDRERIQRAEVPNAGKDDLRITPEAELDRVQQRHDDSHQGRKTAAKRDRCRCNERNECRDQAMIAVAKPDLRLREHREHDRDDAVDGERVETREMNTHDRKVARSRRAVISRPVDHIAPEDQPIG